MTEGGSDRLHEVLGVLGLDPPPALPPDLGSPERTHVFIVGDVVVKFDARHGSRSMTREANALRVLAGSSIPVPTLVADGSFDDGRGWVVTERLPGEVPDDAARLAHDVSPSLAAQLGTTVAALHRAVVPPGFGTWTEPSTTGWTLRDEMHNRWSNLAKLGFDRDPLIVDRSELEEVVRLGEATIDCLDGWSTPVLAHRDVQPRNVLVTGERLTALLDFESAGGGDPAEDFKVLALDWTTPGYAAFCRAYGEAGGTLGDGGAERLAHGVLFWVLAVYAYLGRIVPAYLPPARRALERIREGERPPVP